MNRLTRFFVERKTLFWSLLFLILLTGVMAFLAMPKLEDPAVTVKQASVVIIYPGADSKRVEKDVVSVVEEQLRTLPDVRKISATVKEGQALIQVEFNFETPMGEVEQHFDMLRRKISDTEMLLPPGVMAPIVIDDMMDVYGIFYAFSGAEFSYEELEQYAKLLKSDILAVKGVKRVNIGGTQREVIDIEFTPEQIRENGMLPLLVAQALQSSTKAIAAGNSETSLERLSINVTKGASTVDEIASLFINLPDGKKIRLGDLAKISKHVVNPKTGDFYVNGKPALTLLVALESDAVVPDVGSKVDEVVNETLSRFPVGLTVDKIFFQPQQVNEAISSFMLNLIESVLIVIFVLMIAMGWKAGLIIGLGLVLTVALSFPILSALDTTLQRISLGAFIIAMGMLVDNAVVIMDGIMKDRKRGLPKSTYIYRIGKQTALPLLGATIIAAATFLPIYLTTGTVGEFAGDLFLVVCVSLLVSWILAIVQVPVCADQWLSPQNIPDEIKNQPKLNKFESWVKKLVEYLIGHKWLTVTFSFILLAGAGAAVFLVRNVFFPDFNYDQFVIECYYPPESNPEAVRARMFQLSDSIMKEKDVKNIAVSMGSAPGRYCLVRPIPEGGNNYAEFILQCTDYHSVQRLSKELVSKLREIAPEAYIRARKYNFSVSSSHLVEVEFTGPDPKVLRELSAEAEKIMRNSPYVDPYTVQNNWNVPTRQLSVAYSAQSAARMGINREDVGNALMAATDGYTVGVISENDNLVPINLVIRQPDGSRPADLSNIPVWSLANIDLSENDVKGLMQGSKDVSEIKKGMFSATTLSNCIDSISIIWEESLMNRYNGERSIQAECDPDPYNVDATPDKLLKSIKPEIEKIKIPDGYKMRFVGESETADEAMGKVFQNLPVMIVILIVVLLLLFNNWKKLAVILLCFPFVLCGIVPALILTDTPFTFLAILGVMGLMGMIIKNAIVLVDEINALNSDSRMELFPAIVSATVSRVRPVLLASLTTVAGMIPLVGDPMYGPLAVTVIGGLLIGTCVTLLFLPVIYSIFFSVKKPAK
ncbi:MAG: efflux RND transporter permease subunit [Muribaculaceae bacterium]|nr:efflux RND transporter permease subunit [Muribaculaceae bacterium]